MFLIISHSDDHLQSKRRKTPSFDRSTKHEISSTVVSNENISLSQSDQFNEAINDMSHYQDDEDEISATPMASMISNKRAERLKSCHLDQTSKLISKNCSTPKHNPVGRDTTQILPPKVIKQEHISQELHSSPLRGIENDPTRWNASKGSPLKMMDKKPEPCALRFGDWSSGEDLKEVIKKSSETQKDHSWSGKKRLSLSIGKQPRLKQSVLGFAVEKCKPTTKASNDVSLDNRDLRRPL